MAAINSPNNGRKADKIIRDALLAAARQSPQVLKKACEAMWEKAGQGDVPAFNAISDRIDGKPLQSIAHSVHEEPQDEGQLDAELKKLAGKIGLTLLAEEKARIENEAELSSVH